MSGFAGSKARVNVRPPPFVGPMGCQPEPCPAARGAAPPEECRPKVSSSDRRSATFEYSYPRMNLSGGEVVSGIGPRLAPEGQCAIGAGDVRPFIVDLASATGREQRCERHHHRGRDHGPWRPFPRTGRARLATAWPGIRTGTMPGIYDQLHGSGRGRIEVRARTPGLACISHGTSAGTADLPVSLRLLAEPQPRRTVSTPTVENPRQDAT